ncbi:hypothetical protein SAMN04487758_10161 [Enterococcus mundtii]|nr:hypothetical protein SAMN04487758_10161 [Enterococcus mundtii]STD23882.1 Uncharacterised protein [Enterococcus mundtii]
MKFKYTFGDPKINRSFCKVYELYLLSTYNISKGDKDEIFRKGD